MFIYYTNCKIVISTQGEIFCSMPVYSRRFLTRTSYRNDKQGVERLPTRHCEERSNPRLTEQRLREAQAGHLQRG